MKAILSNTMPEDIDMIDSDRDIHSILEHIQYCGNFDDYLFLFIEYSELDKNIESVYGVRKLYDIFVNVLYCR